MDHQTLPRIVENTLDYARGLPIASTDHGRYLLQTLQEIDVICWSEDVQTAAVKRERGSDRLFLNRGFLEEYVYEEKNPELNMAFVLFHEASHVRRSDFSRCVPGIEKRRWRQLKNTAADVFVNSRLYLNGFSTQETVTIRLFKLSGPNFLLFPPHVLIERFSEQLDQTSLEIYAESPARFWSDILNSNPTYPVEQFVHEIRPYLESAVVDEIRWANRGWEDPFRSLLELYFDAWTDRTTLETFAQGLDRLLRSVPRPQRFLGNHHRRGGSNRGDTNNLERWGPGQNGQRIPWFARLLRKALEEGSNSARRVPQTDTDPGVVPSVGRRSLFFLSKNRWPVFFENNVSTRQYDKKAAHVYVDMSGSIEQETINVVKQLILGCEGLVQEPVYLFAHDIMPVSLSELETGKQICGGTRINPVVTHAKKNKLDKFIVITDGGVEELTSPNQTYLSKAKMYVVFEHDARKPLSEYAEEYWTQINDFLQEK